MKAPLTSADVRAAISGQFGRDGGRYAVLFEVRNGTAWRGNRSVDAVVMSLWPSLGMELWGMEIKTSRSDWLREHKSPAKASEVFDYFDRWWLVAPAEIVRDGELPEPWGWFVPENGRLSRVREAAKNTNTKSVDRHFLGALLRRVTVTDNAGMEAAISNALAAQRQQYEADAEKRALQKLVDLRKDAEQWAQLRDLLKDKPADYLYAPDVVAAVRMLLKSGVGASYGHVRSLVDQVARSHEALQKVAADLGVSK